MVRSVDTRYCRMLLALLALLGAGHVMADQRAELQRLQENIQALQQELKNIQGTRSSLQQELEHNEKDMGELLKKIDQIQKGLQQQNRELEQLNQEKTGLQEALLQQEQALATHLRVAYRQGRQSQLQLLLNQESPERLSRLLGYHQRLLQSQRDRLDRYLATLDRLDALEPHILARRDALAENRQALEQQRKTLTSHQTRRQQTLAQLNASLNDKDAELRQMQEDRDRLQQLLTRVTQSLGNQPLPGEGASFSSRKGKLLWPAQGRVVSRFGSPRLGSQLPRNGMLIGAGAGEPVLAVHHGRIVFADYFRGHGLLIIIDHGEGYLSLYAHNQSLFKATGDWVKAGEAIASVGNSGGQEQAGLYFEIRHRGQPTDPVAWLARA